jgi:hypothetical protein
MTLTEKRQLMRAFGVAYEVADRRGFQHGFVSRDEAKPPSRSAVTEWRARPVRKTGRPPPGSGGGAVRIAYRMLFESREHGEVIRDFLRAEPALDPDLWAGEGPIPDPVS